MGTLDAPSLTNVVPPTLDNPARVPRRFAAGTLMVLVAVYGILIRASMYVGMPIPAVVTIAGILTAAGVGQAIMFRGRKPRFASMISGAIAAPIVAGLFAAIRPDQFGSFLMRQTGFQTLVAAYYLFAIGALLGYCSGCIAAGVFLFLQRLPWLGHTPSTAAIEEPPAATAVSTRLEQTLLRLSPIQPEFPLREALATATLASALLLPQVFFLPWWTGRVYLPVMTIVIMLFTFFRTGGRLASWRVTFGIVALTVACGLIPAVATHQLSFDYLHRSFQFFVTLFACGVIGALVAAGLGWTRWIATANLGPLDLNDPQDRRRAIAAFVIALIPLAVATIAILVFASQPLQRALQHVRKIDGQIQYTYPSGRLRSAYVSFILLGDECVDDDLRYLSAFPRLDGLTIVAPQITDEGVAHLVSLHQLRELTLRSPQLTDAGMERIKGLNQLVTLDLSGTAITTAGLNELISVNLRILNLRLTKIDDSSIPIILQMSKLNHLDLSETSVTPSQLKELAKLPALTSLSLNACDLTDGDIEFLRDLGSLTRIELKDNQLTDESVRQFGEMTSLNHLDVTDNRITSEARDELEDKLPGCRIFP